MTRARFVPALRFHALSRIYDPFMERWTAASRMRATVIAALDLRPGLQLLELGCGPGRLAIEIKRRHPDVTIDAVDADPVMVEQARQNAATAAVDIEVREADVTRLPDTGRYDRIYSTLVFHHLLMDGKHAALASARRMLNPGGRFVVADFVRPQGPVQAVLTYLVWPLDGIPNTSPHRDGRFERALEATFAKARLVATWRTVFGTLGAFICEP